MASKSSSQDSAAPFNDHKRAAEELSPPPTKRTKNDGTKSPGTQQTIEESLTNNKKESKLEVNSEKRIDSDDDNGNGSKEKTLREKEEELKRREIALEKREQRQNGSKEHKNSNGDDTEEAETKNGNTSKTSSIGVKNAFDVVKSDAAEAKKDANEEQDSKSKDINKNNGSIVIDEDRKDEVPSSILEKGIIYFFFRSRVNTDEPQGIQDIARSYIVLRPLPLGAKIGDGPLEDLENARLIALPKKMLPKSGRDRFLAFVEKAGLSIKDIRDQFQGTAYATKTSGTSQVPAATPFAEGIYAITNTGTDSHLAYHITVPSEIGQVQKELGLNEKGSYNISLKNPEASAPANAQIDNPAKYTKEIQEEFRGRRWMPVTPETLNFDGSQFLLIGEGQGTLEKAVNVDLNEDPEEEIEKLEEEDNSRVENLKGDDPVFVDLGLSSKQYSHLQTTW